MGLFNLISNVVTLPVRVVDTTIKDITGSNGGVNAIASLSTLGLTSAVKSVAKASDNIIKDNDKE